MISLFIFLIAFQFEAGDLCAVVANEAPSHEIVLKGYLVFNHHTPYLTNVVSSKGNIKQCGIYVLFPGDPNPHGALDAGASALDTANLNAFVERYGTYSRKAGNASKLLILRGKLFSTNNFTVGANGRGNGFGSGGRSAKAFAVRTVEGF